MSSQRPSDNVWVTEELIESGMSRRGAWSREQLAILGIAWPPSHGWKKRAVGKKLSAAEAERFVALRDAHLPAPTPSLPFPEESP